MGVGNVLGTRKPDTRTQPDMKQRICSVHVIRLECSNTDDVLPLSKLTRNTPDMKKTASMGEFSAATAVEIASHRNNISYGVWFHKGFVVL